MSVEKIDFTVKVYDNFIEIKPTAPIKDNSLYEIKFKDLKTVGGYDVDNFTHKVSTAMTPMYCSIHDVRSVFYSELITDEDILYNIRSASRFADFLLGTKKIKLKDVTFEVQSFVKYRALKECLLKAYMGKVELGLTEGTLGYVTFKNQGQPKDIKDLLKLLEDEIAFWKDALWGYVEGTAKMRSAIRGYHHGGYNPYAAAERRVTPKTVPVSMNRGVR